MTVLSAEERRERLSKEYPVWPKRTLPDHFREQAGRFGARPAVMTEDREFTYAELWEQAERYAKSLIQLGVGRREHVALLLANEPEAVSLMIAVWMVGAVCVPINTMLRDEELKYILKQSDSRWLFLHQFAGGVMHAEGVLRIQDELPLLKQTVCIQNTEHALDDSFMPWEEFLKLQREVLDEQLNARAELSRYADEVADIIYTSGSTGQPKGVMITHDMFLRCAYATALSRGFEDGRRIFTALPLYHVFALVEGILALSFVGGAHIMVPGFAPLQTLQILEKRRANDMLCVPSMLVALINHPEVQGFDLSSLYALMCAAAPAPVSVWQRAIDILKLTEICTGYGGTEVTASTAHTEIGDAIETVVTRVGRIKPGGIGGMPEFGGFNVQYKTVDPATGEDLPAGEIGDLTVRGNIVTKGYYNKPEETFAAIDKDGWFRTGDLGRLDENGYIELLGRSKEMYKISGENVAPKEVEDVINKHPAVAQAYVVGVKDPQTVETGAAFIELRQGHSCTRMEIVDFCNEHLARFKVPRHVWFVTSTDWPITGNGKIQKFRLQEMAERRLSERGKSKEPV
ncbi:class I adenylate-forming enzyme family protein [Cohnella lubricantis]|uniref:Acyl--CoA ligase n=1 Tax=Cohnella lubricantis TaxID=2163172 RepID=A0A841T6S1_9BACL|nr:class I adenylate-forming enzyme family protein [Cohnella lubricantis]MBB6675819.1 acyl--CoA ligase [Cohnella lubricantis]MBP2119771.1 fatty-acyl-CoA synthase [Cohnella lubricantis]